MRDAPIALRRGDRIMADFARVGIDEQLIGIEAVAEPIYVCNKAELAAFRPCGVEGPVGSPGAVAIENGACDCEFSANAGECTVVDQTSVAVS